MQFYEGLQDHLNLVSNLGFGLKLPQRCSLPPRLPIHGRQSLADGLPQ